MWCRIRHMGKREFDVKMCKLHDHLSRKLEVMLPIFRLSSMHYKVTIIELPHDKTNIMTVHPARLSLGIRLVWSECRCTQWVANDPSFLHADSEDWSDWMGAQADLSLRWAHMPFCWFCHEAAHIVTVRSRQNAKQFRVGRQGIHFVLLKHLTKNNKAKFNAEKSAAY